MSEPVTKLTTRALPETVRITRGMQLTPNEMRTLREKTGQSLTDLLGGDTDDMDAAPDRIQSLIWVQLRRQGYTEIEWDEVGDVIPEIEDEPADPTKPESSATSPPSASSGT